MGATTDTGFDLSDLPPSEQTQVAQSSSQASTQARTQAAYDAMKTVVSGGTINYQQAGAIIATAAYIEVAIATGSVAAASAAGGVTALAVTAVGAFLIAFAWISDKLGWTAGAGPGSCAHPDLQPGTPQWDQYAIKYDDPTYGFPGWTKGSSGAFEDWMRPALILDWEVWNNVCHVGTGGGLVFATSMFTGPNGVYDQGKFLAAIKFWNDNHSGPSRTINVVQIAGTNWNTPPVGAWDPIQFYMRNMKLSSITVNDGNLIARVGGTTLPGGSTLPKSAPSSALGKVASVGGIAAGGLLLGVGVYAAATKTPFLVAWQRFWARAARAAHGR